jgi:hypothetical protein
MIGCELLRLDKTDHVEIGAVGCKDSVIRCQRDRRTTGGLQCQQIPRIWMDKYLCDARLRGVPCPDGHRARQTNLPVVCDQCFCAVREQSRNPSSSARRRDERVRRKTELARQIAPGRPEGQHARARQEMIERLLLYRIDTETARAAIGEQFDLSAFGPANEAQSTLAFAQLARSWADIALHPAIVQGVPVLRLDDRAVRSLRRKRLWPVHAPIMRPR